MRFLSLLLLLSVTICQAQTPDFSGIWKMNPAKSKNANGQPPEDMRAKIDQKGGEFSIALRVRNKGQEEINTVRYVAGSNENRNELHGAPMTSKAAWDGASLVVDSTAKYGSDTLVMHDRWSLSQDGQTLNLTQRHQFASEVEKQDTIVFEKQTGATWEPPQPPKMAEEVYKNIQVMKGVPAPRLMGAMSFFTRSLGVRCEYCHDPSALEKDDKPAKITARHMLNMVHQINEANFPSNQIVSCWMCHRGNAKPEGFPK